jgi:Transcription-silencing protein, cryptic loci regulator Clr2
MVHTQGLSTSYHAVTLSDSTYDNPLPVRLLKMPTPENNRADSSQQNTAHENPWQKRFPYLYSLTFPSISVRQTIHEDETTKDSNILLITRSDGVHKIGYLPNEEKDTRLGDDTGARQAYLCRVGSILAAKTGISSGGNKPTDMVWDVLPEVLFGYEIFERARDRVTGNKTSDLYVVGHPIEGKPSQALFRTPEEFAEHLLWLAEGDEEKSCKCVLCTKEAMRRTKMLMNRGGDGMAETWRQECHERAKSYLDSTLLGSFWGNLPDLKEDEE